MMKKLILFPALWIFATVTSLATSSKDEISRILQESEIKGGFVVHVGSTDGSATAALRPSEGYQAQALVTDSSKLDTVRKEMRKEAGIYGPIAADFWEGGQLPYIDNLVNLLLIEEGSKVSQKEIQRVLTPLGKAYQKKGGEWKVIEKQWPEEIDEWTHYLHGADGNAVAKDTRVGPPRRL